MWTRRRPAQVGLLPSSHNQCDGGEQLSLSDIFPSGRHRECGLVC